ncbi:MAG TPA: 5'-nucleotidase C-terminal domain-containing protein [Methylomirabilota bacterium]|nr:5'-nucleotidase C-terminal domain-containing protein [Methylomirabilota bacterium]
MSNFLRRSPRRATASARLRRGLSLFPFLWVICVALAGSLALTAPPARVAPRAPTPVDSVHITLLGTTDLHGHVEPLDYYTNTPANLGLAKIATLIRQARAEQPNALLLDSGDTIQGTPLAYYFAEKDTHATNPMMLLMNSLGYDAMAVGNHEFNFGLDVLWKAKREAQFPILGANIEQAYSGGVPYFKPYIIKQVDGVRVAIVGFVTPGIPRWEIPEHYRGYIFEPIVEAAKRVIPEVRKQADLVVVIAHSGLGPDPAANQAANSDEIAGENVMYALAEQVPGIDVILFGHTHHEVQELFVNGVLLVQAKNWGGSLARVDVNMKRDAAGHWEVQSKHSTTIPATDSVAADPEILKLAAPYEAATQKYLDTPVATSPRELSGATERFVDGPLVTLINRVQMEYGQADVSMATMFYPGARIPAGNVTIRQLAALYVYENTLYTVEMTGAQLRQALEHAATFFQPWPLPAGATLKLPDYGADSALGVSYKIDLTKPASQRITNLTFKGHPLGDTEKLRVAINNYRYTGGGQYSYKGLPILYRSPQEIRDLIIEYVTRTGTIPAEPDHNWEIVPREAVDALRTLSESDSRHPTTRLAFPRVAPAVFAAQRVSAAAGAR